MRDGIWREMFSRRDVVVISPQYWGDIWVSKHWIADQLSDVSRVLFVEPPIWVGGVVKGKKGWRKNALRCLRPLRKIKANLHVASPRFFPYNGSVKMQVAQFCGRALKRLGMHDPIILNFDTNYELVRALKGSVNVYYSVDPVFPRPGEEQDERYTCVDSDLILAVSKTYEQHLAEYGASAPIRVIPHGFAYEDARRVDEDPQVTIPSDLEEIHKPIIGFTGSIHDAVVDVDRLESLSMLRPHYSFVLVGPYQNNPLGTDLSPDALQRIRKLKNVHLLGPKHFKELPNYVKFFDVALVLTNTKDFNRTFKTGKRTLFKWLLYFSMGKPVVAPWMDEAESIAHMMYMVKNEEAFAAAIDSALQERQESAKLERINYASNYSFDKTLDRITAAILEVNPNMR